MHPAQVMLILPHELGHASLSPTAWSIGGHGPQWTRPMVL